MTPEEALHPILTPALAIDDDIFRDVSEESRPAGRPSLGRAQIPKPTEFAISLKESVGNVEEFVFYVESPK